mgnify:CR=1 FL=1
MRRYLNEFLSDKRVIDYPAWKWQPLLQTALVEPAAWTGFIVVVATVLIGVIVGSIAAYYGGLTDNIIMPVIGALFASSSTLIVP